jgi:MoaA/NifB/PqqE/SkfB family radical SAM enzyme
VTFTGGEPTMRDDLVELVGHAEKIGQVTGLLTDGRRLVEAPYLSALSQAGLDHILITLNPDDEGSMAGLRAAIASDIHTAAHLTLMPGSPEISGLLEGLRALGLTAVSLSASEASEDLTRRLADARGAAARSGLSLVWDLPAPYSALNPLALELEAPPQGAGRAFLYVEPDGDVLPAQGVDRILGNFIRDGWAATWRAAQTNP